MKQEYAQLSEIQPLHPGLESLEDGFCMLDGQWRVSYWNAAAGRLLGRARPTLLQRVVWDALPFLREGAAWENLWAVARDRTPRRFLMAYPPDLGSGRLSVYAAPVEHEGIALHFRDASEEARRAERSSALLESIRDGFLAVDEQWKIVYLNAVAEGLLRFRRDQALGASLWSLLPRGPVEIRDCLRATMTDGISRHVREVQPEGRIFRGRIFDLWTHPVAGGGISVLFEDVSERVQRERELARLAEAAAQANQAKSRFFAAISHELRTPLNAIVGYTHLLAAGTYGKIPEGAHRAADRSSVCAEHLSRLVDDLLLLTTAEVGRLPVTPCLVRLADCLPGMVQPLRHQAESKGLRFELELSADLPLVETDPQRLRQLLVAVVSNAVKYTSRGRVRVEASVVADTDASGDEGAYSLFPTTVLEIRVSDTGPGIAPEDWERIFGAFEQCGDPARSDSLTRGSGLGLTVARQICALLGGRLYLSESSPAGSSFSVRLPLEFPRHPL